jgi:hypothetical protein
MPKENDSGRITFSTSLRAHAFAAKELSTFYSRMTFYSKGYTCFYTVRVFNMNIHSFLPQNAFSDFSYIKDSESITVKNTITAKL